MALTILQNHVNTYSNYLAIVIVIESHTMNLRRNEFSSVLANRQLESRTMLMASAAPISESIQPQAEASATPASATPATETANEINYATSEQDIRDRLNNQEAEIHIQGQFGVEEPFEVDYGASFIGDGETSELVYLNEADQRPLFLVSGDNAEFQDLTLTGTSRDSDNSLVQLVDSPSEVTFDNVTFRNQGRGIENRGNLPTDLTVTDSTFDNVTQGISLQRDALLEENSNDEFRTAGGLNISNNEFLGQQQFGIQIDAGNDGVNPDNPPGFDPATNNVNDRGRFTDQPTQFESGGVIRGNEIQAATQFGVALANVGNVDVVENDITLDGEGAFEGFTSGVNVEHNSNNINIAGNDIQSNKTNFGDQNVQGVSVIPFQDHGNIASIDQASSDILVSGNEISGDVRTGVFLHGAQNTTVEGNQFDDLSPVISDIGILDTFDGNSTVENNNGDASVARNQQTRAQSEDPTR